MAKGEVYASEARTFTDRETGVPIRQVTAHPTNHHHPFCHVPCYDDAMERLVLVSNRTGRPEVFVAWQDGGNLLQLTDHADIAEWSVHPSHDGAFVYFTSRTGAWRVDTETLEEEQLVDFGGAALRGKGRAGVARGTTALSPDDRWWAVPVSDGDVSRLVLIDAVRGCHSVILERKTIRHPQFHPNDPTLLHYAGPHWERLWVINRDATGNRLVYQRDAAKKEWICHELWSPRTREIFAVNWPHGMMCVDIDSGAVHDVCRFNAWHPSVNRAGTLMCADTNYPDVGLVLFDPSALRAPASPRPLCMSDSSNLGAHWDSDHCPFDDGPTRIYAPRHTHPHPSFSPDGRRVVFTSDTSGHSQVYEVCLPDGV